MSDRTSPVSPRLCDVCEGPVVERPSGWRYHADDESGADRDCTRAPVSPPSPEEPANGEWCAIAITFHDGSEWDDWYDVTCETHGRLATSVGASLAGQTAKNHRAAEPAPVPAPVDDPAPAPMFCKRCDSYGVIVPVASSVTVPCPECGGVVLTGDEVKASRAPAPVPVPESTAGRFAAAIGESYDQEIARLTAEKARLAAEVEGLRSRLEALADEWETQGTATSTLLLLDCARHLRAALRDPS